MGKQHVVRLSTADRAQVAAVIRRTGATALEQRRARILLHADAAAPGPHRTDREVAAAVAVDPRTVARVRMQYATQGLTAALSRRRRGDRGARAIDGAQEARLVALACSAPPPGHARWSLRLLADHAVRLEIVDAVSHETVRGTLKKTTSSRG